MRLYFVGFGGASWRDPRNWSREEGGRPLRHFHARGDDVVVVVRVEGHARLDLRGMPHAGLELRGYQGALRLPGGGRVSLAAPAPKTRLARLCARARREVSPVIPPGFRGAVKAAGGWRKTVREGLALVALTRRGLVLVPALEGGSGVTRFWVGGAGAWDGASTAHWSASTGGAAGASAPTLADTAQFDSNSGLSTGVTITIASSAAALIVQFTTPPVGKTMIWALSGSPTFGDVQFGGFSNKGPNRLLVQSDTVGTQRTITASSYTILGDINFQDINLAYSGGASWTNTGGAYIGDCGGNAGAVTTNATASAAVSHTGATFTWSTVTWTGRTGPPLPQDDVTISGGSGTYTISMDMPQACRSLDLSGVTGTATFTASALAWSIFGNLTLGNAITWTSSATVMTLAGRGAQTITCGTRTIGNAVTVSAPGGSYTCQDNFTASRSLVLFAGTFDANAHNVSVTLFQYASGITAVLNMGAASTWTLSATGGSTPWNITNAGSLTINCSTSIIAITDTTGTKTFAGAGFTYGTLQFKPTGSNALTITGSNTFANLDLECTTARTITLPASGTQTVTGALTLQGAAAQVLSLVSSSPGTTTTISQTGCSGSYTHSNTSPSADVVVKFAVCKAASPFPYSTLLGLAATAALPYASSGGITQSVAQPYEAPARLAKTSAEPYEVLLALAATKANPYEALARLAAVTTGPYEALKAVAATGAEPYETLKALAAAVVESYETLKALATTGVLPFSAPSGIAAAGALPYATLGGLRATGAFPYEGLASIRATGAFPFSALLGLAASGILPYSALRGVNAGNPSPYEALAGLAVAAADPYETLGRVAATGALPYSALLGLAADGALNYEATAGVAVAGVLPYSALKGVSAVAALPYEAVARLVRAAGLPYSTLKSLAAMMLLPYEDLVGLAKNAALPVDAVSGVAFVVVLPYETLTTGSPVVAVVVLPYETRVGRIGTTSGFTLPVAAAEGHSVIVASAQGRAVVLAATDADVRAVAESSGMERPAAKTDGKVI